ncbi:GNAT family N-acetyltransferase, partial [Fischerella thermalis CCMEE 5328]
MIILTQTDRLIIRTWVPEQDAEQAFQIYGDHEVTRFLITKVDSVESSRNLLQRWVTNFAQLNNGTGLWAIALKDSREIVGTI